MDEEKRKKKKSKRHDHDVDKIVEKAMRDVEKAMADVKIAEKVAKSAGTPNWSGMTSSGAAITVNNYVAPSGANGPSVFINQAQNVQVGENLTMNINNGKTKKKRTNERERKSSTDSVKQTKTPTKTPTQPVMETGASRIATETQQNTADSSQQQNVPSAQSRVSEMSPIARKQYELLKSERQLTIQDLQLCSVCIGNFTRFLRILGIEDNEIDILREEHHSAKEIIYQGITLWQQKLGHKATVGALCKVLMKIDSTDAMNYLEP